MRGAATQPRKSLMNGVISECGARYKSRPGLSYHKVSKGFNCSLLWVDVGWKRLLEKM